MRSHNAWWSSGAPIAFLALWSSGFVFLKLGLQFADPLTFLAVRYACVLVILLLALLWIKPSWPNKLERWVHLGMVGLFLHAGYFSFTYLSLHHGMSAGGIALITSQQPILVGLLAPLVSTERVSASRWAGLILGVTGAMLVILSKRFDPVAATSQWGLLYAVLALAVITASTLWEKRFGTDDNHPIAANLIQYSLGLVVVLPLAGMLEPMRVQWNAWEMWTALAYLVICNSIVAITLLLAMIRRGEVSKVSALFFLVPPATAVIAYLLLDEAMSKIGWFGIVLATGGIYLAMRQDTRRGRQT